MTPVPLGDSARVEVGEPVAAIGSPLGNENSLAVGVVSAIHRSIDAITVQRYKVVDAIQTDAPITHGNSGGPLFDARGRVVGINAQIRSANGTGNDSGVGFAIPIDAAKRSVQQLIAKGKVTYAYVGIETDDMTPSLARALHYKVDHGALVVDVKAGSPAARAGLHGGNEEVDMLGIRGLITGGDVIVAIGNVPGGRCRRRRPDRLLVAGAERRGRLHRRPRRPAEEVRGQARRAATSLGLDRQARGISGTTRGW